MPEPIFVLCTACDRVSGPFTPKTEPVRCLNVAAPTSEVGPNVSTVRWVKEQPEGIPHDERYPIKSGYRTAGCDKPEALEVLRDVMQAVNYPDGRPRLMPIPPKDLEQDEPSPELESYWRRLGH